MSAEAWVGVAAIVAALLAGLAGGCIAWMSKVHWMLADIRAKMEALGVHETESKVDRKNLWEAHGEHETRLSRVEAHVRTLRTQGGMGSGILRSDPGKTKLIPPPPQDFGLSDDGDSDDKGEE